ncbi:hypothetical protein QYF36_001161 [Acer negundo]|nr:hypothetical protein QYF36_001161 [Acer negundo]
MSALNRRTAPPSRYWIEIESFSLLKASKIAFTSGAFDAGDYKWKLSIYPTAKSKNGKGRISFYLELVQTSSLPAGWEVNVIYKIFVFNYLQNKYLSIKDWCEYRCHEMNTSFGTTESINLETFSNPTNGFISDDTCVFGVDVFVVKNTLNKRRLSVNHQLVTYFLSWKVNKLIIEAEVTLLGLVLAES